MKLKKLFAWLLILFLSHPYYALSADILMDTGQRQTIVERTKQYASGVDANKIKTEAALDFQKDIKVHTNINITGQGGNCGGYTTSACGLACCGKEECESACIANRTTIHGHDTCLDPVNTSWCGMSCCGADDCNRVCYNYRTTTASSGNCGGYIKTATGASCCGFEDCRNKSCGGYTSTIHVDTGTEMQCCGETNCNNVRCDYNHSTEVISGGTAPCCGVKDCYNKYCEGEVSTVPVSGANKDKTVSCCGKSNCHNVKCDGYTQTNTPTGPKQCCGYEDCRNKECEGRFSAVDPNTGKTVACCGILDCTIKQTEKTYTQPINKCDSGWRWVETCEQYCQVRSTSYCVTWGNRCRKEYKYATDCCNAVQTVHTSTGTYVPSGCKTLNVTYNSFASSTPVPYYTYQCSHDSECGGTAQVRCHTECGYGTMASYCREVCN